MHATPPQKVEPDKDAVYDQYSSRVRAAIYTPVSLIGIFALIAIALRLSTPRESQEWYIQAISNDGLNALLTLEGICIGAVAAIVFGVAAITISSSSQPQESAPFADAGTLIAMIITTIALSVSALTSLQSFEKNRIQSASIIVAGVTCAILLGALFSLAINQHTLDRSLQRNARAIQILSRRIEERRQKAGVGWLEANSLSPVATTSDCGSRTSVPMTRIAAAVARLLAVMGITDLILCAAMVYTGRGLVDSSASWQEVLFILTMCVFAALTTCALVIGALILPVISSSRLTKNTSRVALAIYTMLGSLPIVLICVSQAYEASIKHAAPSTDWVAPIFAAIIPLLMWGAVADIRSTTRFQILALHNSRTNFLKAQDQLHAQLAAVPANDGQARFAGRPATPTCGTP